MGNDKWYVIYEVDGAMDETDLYNSDDSSIDSADNIPKDDRDGMDTGFLHTMDGDSEEDTQSS